MKKRILLAISLIALSALSVSLTSCYNELSSASSIYNSSSQNNNSNNDDSKVKLLSMETSKIAYENKDRMLKKQGEEKNINYQYIVLENSQEYFEVTINLYNPLDYHILDFKMSCDYEELEILIDDNYVLLNSLESINWGGDTNKTFTLGFKSQSEDFINTLKIDSMLYIDRTTTSLSYDVDVSENNEVNIYRVHSLDTKYISLSEKGLEYQLISDDDHIENINIDNVEYVRNQSYYTKNNLIFEYSYNLNDTIIYNDTLNFTIDFYKILTYMGKGINPSLGTQKTFSFEYLLGDITTEIEFKAYNDEDVLLDTQKSNSTTYENENGWNYLLITFNGVTIKYIVAGAVFTIC